MTLSRLQLPPRPAGASDSTTGGPPAIGTFFSLPAAKNPMNRLSGDQNGNVPPSVPGIGLCCQRGDRSQPDLIRGWAPATNTMCRPSGDTANCVAVPVPPPGGPPNDVFSGGAIVNCTASAAGVTSPARRSAMTAAAISASVDSAATSHATRLDRAGGATVWRRRRDRSIRTPPI